MERAGTFLGRTLRRLQSPDAALAWLSSAWPTIVGKALAAHTRPLSCEKGKLKIAADGKAWQKQLESMKQEFCARINQAWGGHLIREVEFIAAKRALRAQDSAGKPGPKRSHELDNEHTPFIRRRKS